MAQFRLEGVEQAALADAGWPDEGGYSFAQAFAQRIEAMSGFGAGVDDVVTDAFVDVEEARGFVEADQVDFVGADDRGDVLPFRADEKAVQHFEVWFGIGAGDNENHLVGVGDDDLFPFAKVALAVPAAGAASGGQRLEAGERAHALVDQFDDVTAVVERLPLHAVAHGDDGAFAALFFQASANARDDLLARIGQHGVKPAL